MAPDRRHNRHQNTGFKHSGIREVHGVSKNASATKLKKKIRDLERLLRKPGLSSTKQVETERALDSLKGQLDQALEMRHEKTMKEKYTMVRFIETKKASKKLRQALKSGDEAQIRTAEIDFYYVTTFPIAEKYVSLFPTTGKEESEEEREKYRASVASRIESGELPSGVTDDGKSKAMEHMGKRKNKSQSFKEWTAKEKGDQRSTKEESEEEEEEDDFLQNVEDDE